MSASLPFDGSPTRTDWLFASLLAWNQIANATAEAVSMFAAIGEGDTQLYPATRFQPPMITYINDDIIIVSVAGTGTAIQWVLNILGSAQVETDPLPGQQSVFFGYAGLSRFGYVQSWIAENATDHRIVFLGHSLGGALAQVMTAAQIGAGPPVDGCYVLGAPRVGDPSFAASIGSVVWRLEDTDDPIVTVPPTIWAGPGSIYPIPGPPPAATYQHAGLATTMDSSGVFSAGSFPISTLAAAAQILTFSAPTHLASEYTRRLRQQWGGPLYLTPGAFGYAAPAVLLEAYDNAGPGIYAELANAFCVTHCGYR